MRRNDAAICIVGTACRFPDADTPAALFQNSVEGRRSFRPIPAERLLLSDYDEAVVGEADSITRVPAGLLAGWRFDSSRFRVPRSALEAADPAHWLALEVAADAVDAAGGIDLLDRQNTAVIVANTLTGEMSRAALLRLRWPWLDRLLGDALARAGVADTEASACRQRFRDSLMRAFRAPDEESLAGGLSNTIAGRIANHFDLHGGAWTVDGACASSLVAVANAAELIASGGATAVIVAAVDLSLDPFELVGFSRNGALAAKCMRVFDARAEGFWPGEGAGAIVLMSRPEAARRSLPSDVVLAGWGLANDGRGGLTRPDRKGQLLALRRAYARAALEPAALGFVEAHGTGTTVGDQTEVGALADLLASSNVASVPIASIKANIGHTKAAAGLAGLIRTVDAVRTGIVPPHVGCEQPHPIFAEVGQRLRVPEAPEEWRPGVRVAGISSFGFGGINAHVVVKAPARVRSSMLPAAPAPRDCELFLFQGADHDSVGAALKAIERRAPSMSLAEMADCAAAAAGRLQEGSFRAAFVASDPLQLRERAAQASATIGGSRAAFIHWQRAERPPRIGLLFPGQAAPVRRGQGIWAKRFGTSAPCPPCPGEAPERTDIAQPAIVSASLAGLELLDRLSIEAVAGLGHSLGELSAFAWAGAIDRAALVELAAARGRAMAAMLPGAMIRLAAGVAPVERLAARLPVNLACFNSDAETIVAGPFAAIDEVEKRARLAGIESARLGVSHAFHSSMMAAAAGALRQTLRRAKIAQPQRPIVSSITGGWLTCGDDLKRLLIRQLTAPVRFTEAARALREASDLCVEVGPGSGLSRLVADSGVPAWSLDVFADSTASTLDALAKLFVSGVRLDPRPLFSGPGIRPFSWAPPLLLSGPCGVATADAGASPAAMDQPGVPAEEIPLAADQTDPLRLLIELVAQETGLPATALSGEDRFLEDLHLNSLLAARLIARFGKLLGKKPPGSATVFANARLQEVVDSFTDALSAEERSSDERVAGPLSWVRCFRVAPGPANELGAIERRWNRALLSQATLSGEGDGLLIDVDRPWDSNRDALPLLRLCQAAAGRFAHLAIRHDDAPLSGFARTMAAERLFDSVRLVQGPCAERVLRRDVRGFEELLTGSDGSLSMPRLAVVEQSRQPGKAGPRLGALAVTGGARGIGAECAIRLAERYGCPLVLIGRSSEESKDVVRTMHRLQTAEIRARYVRADVVDRVRLRAGLDVAVAELGPVTHLIHAAGVNDPALLGSIDEELLARTIAPKVQGLAAAVEACGPSLQRVVVFGSIIGRLGLPGEAHYALANAEQTRLLAAIAESRPGLSTLSIEWSVWSGVGMGERLAAIERLSARGVDPISLDAALDSFEALALGDAQGAIMVTSRFGAEDPVPAAGALRFVDRPLVHTAGVELVAETSVGIGRDPYLDDHRLNGLHVMPGVMLLEAMAQTAIALTGQKPKRFTSVRFTSAVQADIDRDSTIRIGALCDDAHFLRAEVRSEADNYADPCASARLDRRRGRRPAAPPAVPTDLDPTPLYGSLFFHGSAFKALSGLGGITSRALAATFEASERTSWFGSFEPQKLVLGDPARRDAALHALQCCVPHRRLVPVSVRRIEFFGDGPPVRLHANEIWSSGDEYAFDIVQLNARHEVVEYWREAVFRAVGTVDIGAVLSAMPELAQPYLERRSREETGDDSLMLALVEDGAADRDSRRERAALAVGFSGRTSRRGDGRRSFATVGRHFSIAHCGNLTIAVSAANRVGCDVERVAAFAGHELARAWTAGETLRKIGSRAQATRRRDSLYTGDADERIAAIAPIPTRGAGLVSVAVGTEATP
jgi:enediyne polyketide synthase